MAKSDRIISNEIMAEMFDHSDEYKQYKSYVNSRNDIRQNDVSVEEKEEELELDER